ncbi:hypothetical protein ScPMuIL_017490 [Solemya velum]
MAGILYVVTLFWGRFDLYRKVDPEILGDSVPGISIIKPLMGLDPLLEENLKSHFELDYPKFELLFCVQDDQDPALNLYHKLSREYPEVDTHLFIGGKEGIINPMVHNMVPAYENTNYDFVWISSSRVKVSTDILMDMVLKLQQPNVALCHQMPFVTNRNTFANTIEKLHFGGALARYYIGLNVLNYVCATGMSYMFKKTVLEEVNGLAWFGQYLAEDFFLTTAMHNRGYKLILSAYPAQQNLASTSVRAHKDRMVRWSRLRLNMTTFMAAIIEPLAECIPLGIYMAWSLWHLFGVNPYIFFCVHLCSVIVGDYFILRSMENGTPPFSIITYLMAWFVREGLAIIIYLEAVAHPCTIKWGKRTYQVKIGGHASMVDEKRLLET